MLDRLAARVQRIHLVGHSFGGRVVTAAVAASTTGKLQTMTLRQTAFSHNGFARSMNGFFRSVSITGALSEEPTSGKPVTRCATPLAHSCGNTVGPNIRMLKGEN
jgi:hypothetical protein